MALNSGYYPNFIVAHKLVDTLGFALSPLVPICAVSYVYKRTNKYKKVNSKAFWLAIPFFVNGIISVGSFSFDWIFSITPENVYVRGPLFFVSPLTYYFYYTVNLAVLCAARKKFSKEELLILGMLTIIPAVMSVFQLYYFIFLTIWNSTAIAVIINYIFIIHSQTKIDPLTGLRNRVAYNEYIEGLRGKRNIVLSVVTIDLDDFKSINDTHGHHEGDKVLRIFAGQLEDIFEGKGVPIRLGGDEFVVLLDENQRAVVETYIKILNDKINAYNLRSELPYRIKFSYGLTVFDDRYNSVDELIRHSDKLMYIEKQRRIDGDN
ncbi:GGDEF domain-containing protein [Anaeroselena agilis]|uniref:GGDEF domain-containing protein n=1 Tax=Anaeroselena agilis TaxID=3063788 RepID=A0ABU3P4N0_9FIRM|nr:GGDEF domain-containing protein [Selenomonadales bacterium 4137-cl]